MTTEEMRPSHQPPGRPKGQLTRRLGYYAIGIAIGLFLVGSLQKCKRSFLGPQQQQQNPQATPVDGSTQTPPPGDPPGG